MMDLKKEILDVNELLENIITTFSPRIKQRNGVILFEQKAKMAKIEADKFHLSNVIYSLLDNADKYSPQNPNIRLKTEPTNAGICITVSDNGIGMNKENQKKIFEKFYRVPTGDIHNVKGFGLGLTYVKMIIDAHGGSIAVDSQSNIGTNFSIYL